MCIPHGATGTKNNGYIQTKPKKSIKRVSQKQFEKGDPNFIDERVSKYEKEEENLSIFERIFGK